MIQIEFTTRGEDEFWAVLKATDRFCSHPILEFGRGVVILRRPQIVGGDWPYEIHWEAELEVADVSGCSGAAEVVDMQTGVVKIRVAMYRETDLLQHVDWREKPLAPGL